MKRMFLSIALAVTALTSFAAPPPYYVAGSFNSWNAAGNLMTEVTPGVWQAVITGLSGRQTFKITGGTWDWNYPGPDSWLYAPGSGTVTITYDANTYNDGWLAQSQRISLSADPGTWTVAGSFQGWDNANPATAMSSIGGGIYKYSTVLAPGSYDWKAVVTGSWDSISLDNRSVGTANYSFNVVSGLELTSFYVDAFKGTVKMEMTAVPEPGTLSLLAIGFSALLFRSRRL